MSNQADLIVKDLHVVVEKNEILKGLNLTVPQGEVHALMGPNGSGKSTLAYTLMGHPNYTVTGGEVIFKGQNILDLESEERARLGLFLAFQYPTAITGVTMFNFLRTAVKAIHGDSITPTQFRKQIREKMALLKMDDSFMKRYLNDGFSGGEKKRAEILQLALLRPEFAIMDETDSGLDIDALRTVAQGVSSLADGRMGVLIITHYQRILNYIKPEHVHIMVDGAIVESGGGELVDQLEQRGYQKWVGDTALGAKGV
jgi:Fe-S cluster assembly ATP-binding protein